MSLIANNNKRIYYINSKNRISGTHSNFTYQIDMPQNALFDRIAVLQVIIPKSYYQISSNYGNHTFTLQELGVDITITIPQGNYNRLSFQNAVTSLLNTSSLNGWTYAISFSSSSSVQTGKFIFTVTGNSSNQPSFIFSNLLCNFLGFDTDSTNVFVGSTITSTNVISMQREDSIFIHCDACSASGNDVLQEVFSSNSPDFTNIVWHNFNVECYSKSLVTNTKNIYHFYLSDEDGDIISTNGINCQIVIILFQSQTYFDLAKMVLKLNLIKN